MTNKKVARLLLGISIMFILLIVYITAFDLLNHDKYAATNSSDREGFVRRGAIFDRNDVLLAESTGNIKNQKREYPYKNLYAHIIGYKSSTYDTTGIERNYNNALMGQSETALVGGMITFFDDAKYALNGNDEKTGADITLTIDNALQETASKALGNYKGAVVVMNPQTGEIYAMVSKPDFDPTPETLGTAMEAANNSNDGCLTSRATAGSYMPGSTFKVIVAASMIENRMSGYTIDETSEIRTPVSNYGGSEGVKAEIDLETAFKKSNNIYFSEAAIELGADEVLETAKRFMFTEPITLDKVNVNSGTLPDESDVNSYGKISNMALGQGKVSASPLKMALIASAIANDGIMMQPYIIADISDPVSYEAEAKTLKRCVSSSTAKKLKDLMRLCVASGTGTKANVSGKDVCGKTGTAEIDTNSGTAHAHFIGFAPYDNPQVAIAVVLENVPDKVTGGGAAAPIAKVVLEKYFELYK